jgi:broad specificity phosphatase PhoE
MIYLVRHGETQGNALRVVQTPDVPLSPRGEEQARRLARRLAGARNLGDARGTPYAELPVDIFGPDYAPPGGETWGEFHARVDRAWARTLREAAATTPTRASPSWRPGPPTR